MTYAWIAVIHAVFNFAYTDRRWFEGSETKSPVAMRLRLDHCDLAHSSIQKPLDRSR